MTPFVLSVLKYSLLVLLYFFVFRAVRSVALDMAGRRSERRTTEMRAPTEQLAAARTSKGGKPPSHVVVHEADGSKSRNVKLSGPTQIGRGAACAIRLSDTYVSQVHARLYGENGSWFVEDLGSTNGTYLNDRKVASPVEVHAGDVVKVGKTVLELRR